MPGLFQVGEENDRGWVSVDKYLDGRGGWAEIKVQSISVREGNTVKKTLTIPWTIICLFYYSNVCCCIIMYVSFYVAIYITFTRIFMFNR